MPLGKSRKYKTIDDINGALLYGPTGSGKTTGAASFPNSVFICTEDGLGSVEATRWENDKGEFVVKTWADFIGALREVMAMDKVQWVVIDTIDNAIDLLAKKIAADHGESYIDEIGFGKGRSQLVVDVKDLVSKLLGTKKKIILTSHCKHETVNPTVGDAYTRRIPSVFDDKHGSVMKAITSQMDLVVYFDHDGEKTVLRTGNSRYWESKDRVGLSKEHVTVNKAQASKLYDVLNTLAKEGNS